MQREEERTHREEAVNEGEDETYEDMRYCLFIFHSDEVNEKQEQENKWKGN